ncbi:hypothetical protein [Azospirillum sp.]|uniref:hypothetical protein n=1 Tax=Azospirillum sp. TaxID=34012 RepID=UPI003D73E9F7
MTAREITTDHQAHLLATECIFLNFKTVIDNGLDGTDNKPMPATEFLSRKGFKSTGRTLCRFQIASASLLERIWADQGLNFGANQEGPFSAEKAVCSLIWLIKAPLYGKTISAH